jgi:hypothetical protein
LFIDRAVEIAPLTLHFSRTSLQGASSSSIVQRQLHFPSCCLS